MENKESGKERASSEEREREEFKISFIRIHTGMNEGGGGGGGGGGGRRRLWL